jgi:hypothetical protein
LLDQFIDKTAETKPARAGRVVLGFTVIEQRKKFKMQVSTGAQSEGLLGIAL